MFAARFVYVDESKLDPFRLVATVVSAEDVAKVRQALKRLLLPNQRRLHFKSERDQRRRTNVQVMAQLPIEVWLYETTMIRGGELLKRSACLCALVEDLVEEPGPVRLFIENDESVMRHDRLTLYNLLAKHASHDLISYCHIPPKDEPGLWISDGVGWCWPKGGAWQEMVRPLVTRVQRL